MGRLVKKGLWKMEPAFIEPLLFTTFQKTGMCQALGCKYSNDHG